MAHCRPETAMRTSKTAHNRLIKQSGRNLGGIFKMSKVQIKGNKLSVKVYTQHNLKQTVKVYNFPDTLHFKVLFDFAITFY